MATRSIIARKINETESLAVYCHYDGYLEHNGRILYKYYDTPEKVTELIDNGDLCVLQKHINPDPNKKHTRLKPQVGVCIYYGRDMQNPNAEPTITKTKDLVKLSDWAEHIYWYDSDSNQWFHSNVEEDVSINLTPLKDELSLIKEYMDLMDELENKLQPVMCSKKNNKDNKNE